MLCNSIRDVLLFENNGLQHMRSFIISPKKLPILKWVKNTAHVLVIGYSRGIDPSQFIANNSVILKHVWTRVVHGFGPFCKTNDFACKLHCMSL